MKATPANGSIEPSLVLRDVERADRELRWVFQLEHPELEGPVTVVARSNARGWVASCQRLGADEWLPVDAVPLISARIGELLALAKIPGILAALERRERGAIRPRDRRAAA